MRAKTKCTSRYPPHLLNGVPRARRRGITECARWRGFRFSFYWDSSQKARIARIFSTKRRKIREGRRRYSPRPRHQHGVANKDVPRLHSRAGLTATTYDRTRYVNSIRVQVGEPGIYTTVPSPVRRVYIIPSPWRCHQRRSDCLTVMPMP